MFLPTLCAIAPLDNVTQEQGEKCAFVLNVNEKGHSSLQSAHGIIHARKHLIKNTWDRGWLSVLLVTNGIFFTILSPVFQG